jgi:hypothetical protein
MQQQIENYRLAGRGLPTSWKRRHLLEALERRQAGDVLIDNGGRTGEGCVGDLSRWKQKRVDSRA